MVRLVFRPYP